MNAVETSQITTTFVPLQTGVIEPRTRATAPQTLYRPTRTVNQHNTEPQALTLENSEKGISLHVGERFKLNLSDRAWNVRIGNTSLVQLSQDAEVAATHPGYFEAIHCGKTKLYATSDPPCDVASPPNMSPTLFLEIPIRIIP